MRDSQAESEIEKDRLGEPEWRSRKAAFWEWAKQNPHTMQISFPRSGRHWFKTILRDVINKKIESIETANPKEYSDIFCFTDHVGTWKVAPENGKYILLVRDPRDAILSYCMHVTWGQSGRRAITTEEGLALLDSTKIKDDLIKRPEPKVENYMNYCTRFWADLLMIYQPLDTLVIYYERVLLYPDAELRRICKFLDVPTAHSPLQVILSHDRQKDNIREPRSYRETEFRTGLDRYQAHCLKWQRCPAFLDRHVPRIWDRLGSVMTQHGYVQNGHSVNLRAVS